MVINSLGGLDVQKIGVTKKVSLTLTEENWNFLKEIMSKNDFNQSEALRFVIEQAPDKIHEVASPPQFSRTSFKFKPL